MNQDRLNHLCVINVYAKMMDDLNLNDMMQQFIEKGNRQATFGRFI